jgi:hypothetical protein
MCRPTLRPNRHEELLRWPPLGSRRSPKFTRVGIHLRRKLRPILTADARRPTGRGGALNVWFPVRDVPVVASMASILCRIWLSKRSRAPAAPAPRPACGRHLRRRPQPGAQFTRDGLDSAGRHVRGDPELNAEFLGELWGAYDNMPDWEVNDGLTARDWARLLNGGGRARIAPAARWSRDRVCSTMAQHEASPSLESSPLPSGNHLLRRTLRGEANHAFWVRSTMTDVNAIPIVHRFGKRLVKSSIDGGCRK